MSDPAIGLKAHVGRDPHGQVHRVVVTSVSVHDSQVMADGLHGGEQVIYGDKHKRMPNGSRPPKPKTSNPAGGAARKN